jgi:chromosome segregation ATPase
MSRKRLSDLVREEVVREAATAEVEIETTTAIEVPSIPENRQETPELEAEIADLTAALAASRERERALDSQVGDLEGELQQQKALVKNLSDKLEKTEALEAELTEQKALIKKLYSELQEAQSVRVELEEQKQFVQQLSAELEQLKPPIQQITAPEKLQKLARKIEISSAMEPRPLGSFSVPPQPSPQLSNEDIGWFD